jgi:tRNA G18 (ribose-2'-O)-methylase SpoU
VARTEQVTRVDDPRLADYVSLRDVELRKSLEGEHGLFLAEGEKVVRRAVEAGYRVRSLLMAPRWLETLRDVLEAAGDAPCYVADPAVIEGVTGFHVHRGALASMHRRELPGPADVLAGARRIVVCEDLVDHTNVGSIFRSAAALGIDGVLLSPRCADPLYRRAVKVSMGAVLTLPYTRLAGWYDALTDLQEAGFQVLALTPAADAVPLDEIPLGDRVALVFGAEGAGLSPRWLATSDARVTIPISRDIDSLNVSAAAAVAAYILKRRSR